MGFHKGRLAMFSYSRGSAGVRGVVPVAESIVIRVSQRLALPYSGSGTKPIPSITAMPSRRRSP